MKLTKQRLVEIIKEEYQNILNEGKTVRLGDVDVVFDPSEVKFKDLLKTFWEQHDPTQGMQQGNDVGTQYRSGVYYLNENQKNLAIKSRDVYQSLLKDSGYGLITTEIVEAAEFYYAEHYHQQYLAKNPDGYCGVDGTGIKLS